MNIKISFMSVVLIFCSQGVWGESIKFDELSQEMMTLKIDTEVKPPSRAMLLLRKLSYPVLICYLLYQECKIRLEKLFIKCQKCIKLFSE